MADSTEKRIIIVAGVEYPRFKDDHTTVPGKRGRWWVLKEKKTRPHRSTSGSDWRRRGVDLAKIRLKADPATIVILYDFDRGTVERVRLVKGKVTFEGIKQKFGPMVDSDYRWADKSGILQRITGPVSTTVMADRPFIRYFPKVSTLADPVTEAEWLKSFQNDDWETVGMSIRHVYKRIEQIGEHNPGTLRELHLLGHASSSHGASSGTVFVNTDNPTPGLRHALDLDARADLDFTSPTINRARFRKAFASDALSQVWGCNWHRPVRELIRLTAKQLKAKKLKTLQDTVTIPFTWSDPGVGGIKWQFEQFFEAPISPPPPKGKKAKPVTITRDGEFVRRKVTELIDKTYMQKLAEVSGTCVVGGLPGTYSNYDKTGSPKLTHIPTGHYGTGDVFVGQGVLNFYRQSFGFQFSKGSHPIYGRGFGIYCPK
jgi:hypothetical protein